MDDLLRRAREALVVILADGPQPAARVKQRLQLDFRRAGLRFDEREWRCAKFSDFLAGNGDMLVVDQPSGPGDVTVRLKPTASAAIDTVPALLGQREAERRVAPFIPEELWQAFTNPDTERKRFFNRETHRVLHFREGTDSAIRQAIMASPQTYVEMSCLTADEQAAWMHEFLASAGLSSDRRTAMESIVQVPYSTALNQVFAGALGPQHGAAWRQFRSARVFERIRQWAEKNAIDLPSLGVHAKSTPPVAETKPSERRQALHTLIDQMTDAEIDSLLIPWGLAMRAIARKSD